MPIAAIKFTLILRPVTGNVSPVTVDSVDEGNTLRNNLFPVVLRTLECAYPFHLTALLCLAAV